MSLRSVDTHQSRSVVKFYVAQSQRCCVSFFLCFLSREVFCILVASYGHVSLIVDKLDWQRCQSPCCRAYCHLTDSHRHRSIHIRVVHPGPLRLPSLLPFPKSSFFKEERGTRRPKQVPFHNRTHRNFLLFACVEKPLTPI